MEDASCSAHACDECEKTRLVVEQGDSVSLTCEVTAGRPQPTVEWARITPQGVKQVSEGRVSFSFFVGGD